MKRYYMTYESDATICGRNTHTWAFANSIKTAKNYIKKCREIKTNENPRNFKIFDTFSDLEYAECVYAEK